MVTASQQGHVRAVVRIVLSALLLAACAASAPQQRWPTDRGRSAKNWGSCLRIAAALRAECAGDAACAAQVSEDFSRPCYLAYYRAPKPEAGELRSEELSPCFIGRDPVSARTDSPHNMEHL